MKRKILLITTKGCEACRIMDNLVRQAINLYGKPVEYEIIDKEQIENEFLKEHHVNDFPTMVLYQDDDIVFITTGTKPVEVLKRDFVIHFD